MNKPGECYDDMQIFIHDLREKIEEIDPHSWDDDLEFFVRKGLQKVFTRYWSDLAIGRI